MIRKCPLTNIMHMSSVIVLINIEKIISISKHMYALAFIFEQYLRMHILI